MDLIYRIVERDNIFSLMAEVNRKIEEGFRPLGGVSATRSGGYIQAMIKEINGYGHTYQEHGDAQRRTLLS